MKPSPIEFKCRWHARRHGGLAIGLRYHFVMHLVDDNVTFSHRTFSIELLLFTIDININTNVQTYGSI